MRRYQMTRRLNPLLLIFIYCVWTVFLSPLMNVYEANPDEGFNLGKAALVSAGFELFRDIWSDQPPLLTFVLAIVNQWFPGDVIAARLVILAFACVLLGSTYVVVERHHGGQAALLALALLAAAPMFQRLSVSVMIGLPAISLAVLAMAVVSQPWLRWHSGALLAGLLFGLSMQTKFFTILLGPSLLLLLWTTRSAQGLRHQAQAFLTLCVTCSLSFLMVLILAGDAFIEQLLRPHFAETLRQAYSFEQSAHDIWRVLRKQPLLVIAAIFGAIVLRKQLFKNMQPAIVWLVVTSAGLLLHTPIWYHQVLLLFPALAWLGGAGFVAAYQHVKAVQQQQPKRWIVGFGAVLATVSVVHTVLSNQPRQDLIKQAMGERVDAFAALGGWVITDAPLDAFRAGLLPTPHLAVYSHKRITTNTLTPEDILVQLQTMRPHQVAFRRFPVDSAIKQHLDAHYIRTATWGNAMHYIISEDQLPDVISEPTFQRMLGKLTTDFMRTETNFSFASAKSVDGLQRFTEDVSKPLHGEAAWMRPPGSTSRIGACFLRSHQATGARHYLTWARETARVVVNAQSCAGGWTSAARSQSDCQTVTGPWLPEDLDEGMTADTIDFLHAFQTHSREDQAWVEPAVLKALDFLVKSQLPSGAWPYSLNGRKPAYSSLATLNDNITPSHVHTLLKAYQHHGRPEHWQAVQRGVDFLLRVQSDEGGWAQQYDERGQPAAARAFEPAALATLETAYVLRALIDVHRHHPDQQVKAAIERGAAWLERVALGPNRWARFHDLETAKPVYQDRDGVRYLTVHELPPERQQGYRYEEGFPEVYEAIELAQAQLHGQPEPHEQTVKRLATISRLSKRSQAIERLAPYFEDADVPLAASDGLIWSHKFVEQCELLHALRPASMPPVPLQTQVSLTRPNATP